MDTDSRKELEARFKREADRFTYTINYQRGAGDVWTLGEQPFRILNDETLRSLCAIEDVRNIVMGERRLVPHVRTSPAGARDFLVVLSFDRGIADWARRLARELASDAAAGTVKLEVRLTRRD